MLCLQEVYDIEAISELHKRLKDLYAHFYGNVPSQLFGMSHPSLLFPSGLAIISKFQLENLYYVLIPKIAASLGLLAFYKNFFLKKNFL